MPSMKLTETIAPSNQDEDAARAKQENDKSFALTTPKNDAFKRSNTSFHSFRYIVIIVGGLMMGAMLFLRLNITVAMVSMVNKTALYIKEHPNSPPEEYFPADYVETGEFNWNNEVQQIIMTGYMVAYTIPQIFTTRWAMKYGIKNSITLSLAICSIANILSPIMAYWGWQWLLVLRLLNAFGASAILPSMVNAIESWMPYKDSAKGLALFQFTCNIIYCSTPLFSGILTAIHWKWAFHVPGIIGLMIAALWWFVSADNPESSKFTSQKEIDLINGSDTSKQDGGNKKVAKRTDLPWYFMFKIKSFYFLTTAWTIYCSTIGGFLFLLPTYLNRVLKVPVEEVGLLNFTVQIGTMFCMLWPGPVSTFLQNKFKMGLTASRRLIVFICISMVIATYSYLALYHDDLVLVISINRFFHMTNDTIILATVMSQFGKTGLSGLIYSMINTFGNLSTVLFCWVVGKFLDYTGETLECWSWVMFVMVGLNVIYLLVYAIFCHSEPVEVDSPPKTITEDGR